MTLDGSVVGWKSAGCVGAGGFAVSFAVWAALGSGLSGRAAAAGTVRGLSDVVQSYRGWVVVLGLAAVTSFGVAAAALVKVVGGRRPSGATATALEGLVAAVFIAGCYAVWSVWQAWSVVVPGGAVLVLDTAVPSAQDVETAVVATGRPLPHIGSFGVVVACVLALWYVALVWWGRYEDREQTPSGGSSAT
ncbi:hypothetical protein [Krasilnikovia sp. M28-CT-15]|uniref:hypothetical protein n=1 Tax=Krasilnikovia sp. M28-CT-15 TaxID=3373540 RepID=UPI003876CB53